MDDKTWELYKTIGGWLTGGAIGACITLTVTWFRGRRQRILVGKNINYMDVSKIHGNYKTEIIFTPRGTQESTTEYPVNILAILEIKFKNPSNKDFKEFTAQINIDKKHRIIAVEYVGDDKLHLVDTHTNVSITEPTDEYRFDLKPFNRRDNYIITFLIDAKDRDVLKSLQIGKDQAVRFVDANMARLIESAVLMIISLSLTILAAIHRKSFEVEKKPTDYFMLVCLAISFIFMAAGTFRAGIIKDMLGSRHKLF